MLFEQVAVGIEEIPRTDDCTGLIDSKGWRLAGTGEIQCGQHTLAEEEPVKESVVTDELSNNIPAIIDVPCLAEVCALYCRGCDRNELACFDQQGMTWWLDAICTYDIAVIVNAESRGKRGLRKVNGSECELSVGQSSSGEK